MPIALHTQVQEANTAADKALATVDVAAGNVITDVVLERELWLPRTIIANLLSLDRFDDVDIVLDELELLTPAGMRAMVDRNNV